MKLTFFSDTHNRHRKIKFSSGDLSVLERGLALESGFFRNEKLLRIDIPNPKQYNLRIPSGNEAGASSIFWIPGGKLPNGMSEGIIDVQNIDLDNIVIQSLN